MASTTSWPAIGAFGVLITRSAINRRFPTCEDAMSEPTMPEPMRSEPLLGAEPITLPSGEIDPPFPDPTTQPWWDDEDE